MYEQWVLVSQLPIRPTLLQSILGTPHLGTLGSVAHRSPISFFHLTARVPGKSLIRCKSFPISLFGLKKQWKNQNRVICLWAQNWHWSCWLFELPRLARRFIVFAADLAASIKSSHSCMDGSRLHGSKGDTVGISLLLKGDWDLHKYESRNFLIYAYQFLWYMIINYDVWLPNRKRN